MPQFTSDYSFDTGQLNAAQQGDALSGMEGAGGGGADFGGLVGTILGERRRKEQMALAERRRQEQLQEQARQRQEAMMRDQQRQGRMDQQRQEAMESGPYGKQSGFQDARRAQNFRNSLDANRTAAQRASSMVGGGASQAFGDSARQAQAMMMAGLPIYDYTGMKDIVAGNAGASQAAVGQAGENLRQMRAQGGPTVAQQLAGIGSL